MNKLTSIHRLALCLTIVAMVLSVPVNSQAKKKKKKHNSSVSNVVSSDCASTSNAAATAAATYNTDGIVIPANDGKWHTVLCTTIKNPTADDDLYINVSQVTTITTTTATSTSTSALISSGNAKLQMRVLVDGVEARPGPIVFDERLMSLTSNLQSFLSLSCTDTEKEETIVTTSCICSSTTVTPAVISCEPPPAALPAGYTIQSCSTATAIDTDVVPVCNLANIGDQSVAASLEQTLGHAFNFLAPGIGGMGNTHIVQVQEILTQDSANGGTAQALIGPGTLNINAVNLKK